MAWRPARSLDRLTDEIEAAFPGTTVWDIGDEDHQNGYSDHNPNVCCDVVCAVDVLGDGGLSLSAFVAHLLANPHPNLRYVIYNRKIYQRKNGWKAQDYNGVNAHKTHVHVSVGNGPDGRSTSGYDSTASWKTAAMGKPNPAGAVPSPTLREDDESSAVGDLQRALNEALGLDLVVDDVFGPKTTAGVKALQRAAGIDEDGIYGPDSAAALQDLLEDDMALTDADVFKIWAYKNERLTTRDSYAFLRDTTLEQQIRTEQATHTALLKQLLAGQGGLTEEQVTAAVAEGVRQAIDPAELAAAIGEELDGQLDEAAAERAVTSALRKVLGGLDGAGE